jgi:hypothetical protein
VMCPSVGRVEVLNTLDEKGFSLMQYRAAVLPRDWVGMKCRC